MNPRRLAGMTNRAAQRRGALVASSKAHAWVYRVSKGRLGRGWFGAPVLVVEAVGRRSGQLRRVPVLYARVDGTPVVLAANAGSDRTPAWWLNLRHAGKGAVTIRGARTAVRPRELAGAERDRAFAALCEVYPAAEHYLAFTERTLPVIALEPAAPAA